MTGEAAAAADYFQEIEGHFALRRGTPFILSAKDWALMKSWHEEGIPLPVVIEAIDTVFERNEASGRKKVISSLSYCRHAVKELWKDRRDLHVGDGSAVPEEVPAEYLAALADDIAHASPEIAARIRELVREKSVPRIEERLIELEREMIESLVASLPPADAEAVHTEIARSLGDTSRLDESTRKRTEEANLRRIVRERFAVPRLTLFR